MAIKSNQSRGATVAPVLAVRGPSHVARLVIAIVVFAIEFVLGTWALSHVGQKVLKRVPPVAYSNASTAIVLEAFTLRRFASSQHSLPNPKSWIAAKAMNWRAAGGFLAKASATFRVRASERNGRCFAFNSTVALAKPVGPAIVGACESNDDKTPESLTLKVCESVIRWLRIGLSHETLLSEEGLSWLEPRRGGIHSAVRFIIAEVACA